MSEILEAAMVVCFGVSWPINIYKLYTTRSAKGVSVVFYVFILVGYLFGLISKGLRALSGIATPGYIWFFYGLNAVMVSIGILLYFRNKRLDRAKQLK